MPSKRRVLEWIESWADRLGLLNRLHERMRPRLTILMYHRILPDAQCSGYPMESLVVGASAFEAQVGWLTQCCRVIPLSEAQSALRWGDPDRPLVAVTFDDGYRDNAEIAAPILEQHGARGTFFVTAGAVESRQLLWFDLAASSHLRGGGTLQTLEAWLSSLKRLDPEDRAEQRQEWERSLAGVEGDLHARYGLMTPAQVADLARRGHEIGSHTMTHPLLDQLDGSAIEAELAESKALLESWIEAPVSGFAYPNGNLDERVVELVKSTGYRYAVTVEDGSNSRAADPFTWARRDITPRRTTCSSGASDVRSFRAEVCGLRDRWRS